MAQQEEKLNLTFPEGVSNPVLTILHGDLPAAIPLKVFAPYTPKSDATIQTPQAFSDHLNRHGLLQPAVSLVEVRRDSMLITFRQDPTDTDAAVISGKLQESEDFKKLGVNTPKRYTVDELRDFLRMNRGMFSDKAAYAKLLESISKFTAQVKLDLARNNDSRGNTKTLVDQTVEAGGVPFSFNIQVQIFKGQASHMINVEICLDAKDGSVRFWFESPEAAELIREQRDILIDTEVKAIRELGLTVLEF